jgi:excisionase family DNA binding protein
MENTTATTIVSANIGCKPARMLTRHTLAQRLEIGVSTLDKLVYTGKVLAPLKIGRSVRWSADEVERWIAAGAPDAKRWEVLRRRTG